MSMLIYFKINSSHLKSYSSLDKEQMLSEGIKQSFLAMVLF